MSTPESRLKARESALRWESVWQDVRARLEAVYVSPKSAWVVGALLLVGMYLSGE